MIQKFVRLNIYGYLLVFLFNLKFFQVSASQEIEIISNLQKLEDYFKSYDPSQEETLLILDIDDVLIMPIDLICSSHNKKIFEEYLKPYLETLSEDKRMELLSISLAKRKIKTVDPQSPTILKNLAEKKVKCIALTNAWTGKYGIIPSLENLRIQELKNVGYDFSAAFPHLPTKVFNELKSKDPNRFPVYKAGILWTCNLPKGMMLKKFLQHASYKPSRIIFIDDKMRHIESVRQYCQENNINFQGLCYTAPTPSPLNIEIAKIQIDHLIKDKTWLSDEEVTAMIKKAAIPRKRAIE